MRAWQYNATTGGLERNLVLSDDVPSPELLPQLGDAELLIEVLFAGLNPADYKVPEMGLVARAIVRTPATPGMDFCGRVARAGRTVDSFSVGETVFGHVEPQPRGTLGAYVIAKAAACASLPAGIAAEWGAAAPTAGMTACQVLLPNVQDGRGDKVFINGGAGGVGTFAIQIAKALGCHVTVSCSPAKMALCKELGADETIDYTSEDVVQKLRQQGQVFTLVFDNVGSSPPGLYKAADDFLLPSGKFVQVGGAMSLENIRSVTSKMLLPSFLGGGQRKFEFAMVKPRKEDLTALARWMAEGKVKAVIDEVFKFEDVPQAYEKLKSGKVAGKLVVQVEDPGK